MNSFNSQELPSQAFSFTQNVSEVDPYPDSCTISITVAADAGVLHVQLRAT